MQKRLIRLPDKPYNRSNIIKVEKGTDYDRIIKKAGDIITHSGVVIFPAQYFYGIAVDALDIKAVQKVFNIKKRARHNPLLALVADRGELKNLVESIPDNAKKIMEKYWPGSVTIIFRAQNHLPGLLTAGTGRIGLRMPLHPVAKALVHAACGPVTGTSANISGMPACKTIDAIDSDILKNADLVLDAGKLRSGSGSTVVDITSSTPEIVRQGQIPGSEIIETCS